jgi:hypothetical protein
LYNHPHRDELFVWELTVDTEKLLIEDLVLGDLGDCTGDFGAAATFKRRTTSVVVPVGSAPFCTSSSCGDQKEKSLYVNAN